METEIEHRIETLESEMTLLKRDLRGNLLDIQRYFSERSPNPSKRQEKAWALALLNVLLAITLFANARFLHPSNTTAAAPWGGWLRIFWLASAFVWLIFQMYPLLSLLGQKDLSAHKAAWLNAFALLLSNLGLTAILTALILIAAIIGMLFPQLWFAAVAILLAILCAYAARRLLRLRQGQAGER